MDGIVERLVEGGCVFKHTFHIRHVRRILVTDVAVFCHNSVLSISTGEIILNGAENSCVRQFSRE